jgi:hypothetical protein
MVQPIDTATETTVTTLSVNGLDFVLKQHDGMFREGKLMWGYGCCIAFIIEDTKTLLWLDGVTKTSATTHQGFRDAESSVVCDFRHNGYTVRLRVSKNNKTSLLSLVLLKKNSIEATLVVSVSGEHIGFEMSANLQQSLERLSGMNGDEK